MTIGFVENHRKKESGAGEPFESFGPVESARARRFHRSFREYSPTPLVFFPALSRRLGLGEIMLKDESTRFGLNSFKVLGASYAIGRFMAKKLGRPIESLSLEILASPDVRAKIGETLFVTATDGNHGRGVAWTVARLGHKAMVFMPKGSADIRANAIRVIGAKCVVTDFDYDDSVHLAERYARENGGALVQDTAWEGYETIPRWIMQGYMTLIDEVLEQIRNRDKLPPTHMFLQAGVGSFAGAILGHCVAALGNDAPKTLLVEPRNAACIHRSMECADGFPHKAADMAQTIMAGLACGEPCSIAWGILRDYAAGALSCPDFIAANGMRILASPLFGDPQVVSGESGAVGCGVLEYLMSAPEGRKIARRLGLDAASRVLLISTEGDTSPEIYRKIVHYGAYPDPGRGVFE
ncbi:MAG: diaminopropionate ammonia-lyase [Candidatus Accumulibacter sp.]|jgi:diaminopropionate ammonia-lyase|nr:diaminopropionate ammonia-lyase [Accumulibacter sp.]